MVRAVTDSRQDFPILASEAHGQPLVYLDSAASAQKPTAVLDAMRDYYLHDHANAHRGMHVLADRATRAYEHARKRSADFVGAADVRSIVFTRGTTEAINLVAQAYLRPRLQAGDEVVVTQLEHHANWVPWQMHAQATGARMTVLPCDATGQIDQVAFEQAMARCPRLLAISHVSNVLGTVLDVKTLIDKAHEYGVVVVVDGAQAAAHLPIDVQDLDCDFYTFSGHKIYGPTGIGVLYGRYELLCDMDPYQMGGGMIDQVSEETTTFLPPPQRFEAGTPLLAQAVGLAAAMDYMHQWSWAAIQAHDADLMQYARAQLARLPGVQLLGDAQGCGLVSMVFDQGHPFDVATLLDAKGVAVRAGHLCAMPLIRALGYQHVLRVSWGIYNTRDDIDALVAALAQALPMLGGRS